MQDGQPAGPVLASPCGFIFIFIMVNGIGPFSINFSGHLDLFFFPFWKMLVTLDLKEGIDLS